MYGHFPHVPYLLHHLNVQMDEHGLFLHLVGINW